MATQLNIKVHTMTGGPAGDVISLPSPTQALKIVTRSEGWFRPPVYGANETRIAPGGTGAQAAPPNATPAPAAGAEATAGFIHLLANESHVFPPLFNGDYYQDVEVWEIGTAECEIDGTNPGYGR